ncbi:MAG TPA: S9 family peptidase [Phycisphaerae bacterium]|nr:S9 family peptidase [Phycisphaerae bacterium]
MLTPRRYVSLLLVCASGLVGCVHTGMLYKAVPLIPREVLFGNPDKASPQISADGTRLAYLAPVDGVLNVWVGPIDNVAAAKPVTQDTHRGVRIYFWAYTNDHIIYIQDKDGDENWHVYCVNLAGGEVKDLTPIEGIAAQIQEVSPKFPDEILVGLNDRTPQFHDIHRVNIRTGQRSLVLENNEFASFVTDDNLAVRFASRMMPDGGSEMLRRTADGWVPFATIASVDNMTTGPVGFDKSGQVLYMRDSRDRNTAALVGIDLQTGQKTVIAEDAKADINGTLRHPTEKTIQAAGSNYMRQRWQFFDLRVQADFDVLRSMGNADVNILDRTLDDNHWIAALVVDDGPVRYYHYDRVAREAHFLFANRQALDGLKLSRMHPVPIKARDGLELVSYLTLPVGSDPDGDGRPTTPLATVLLVHGGPWARDAWGYNPYAQWLANRGYAVLRVNFRGSTGFGKEFVNAGDKEWAGKTHNDLVDAVEWAVEQRIADADKVAIMGGSYGGYATLVGLTFTPDVFACGVDISGPSSLITLLESIPPYWAPILDVFTNRLGDHRTEEGRALLKARSPLTNVNMISKPLLIGQGANDPRVKQAEADQIVQAMEAKGLAVTYLLYPDEGHGFARPENAMSFNAVAEAFLAEHLGGRYEPIGDDFAGSSITVPAGADGVAGLSAALADMETGASDAGG